MSALSKILKLAGDLQLFEICPRGLEPRGIEKPPFVEKKEKNGKIYINL